MQHLFIQSDHYSAFIKHPSLPVDYETARNLSKDEHVCLIEVVRIKPKFPLNQCLKETGQRVYASIDRLDSYNISGQAMTRFSMSLTIIPNYFNN